VAANAGCGLFERPVVDPRMRLIAQPSEPVLLGRDAVLFVGGQVD
jgi:hypothetical protein